MPPLITDEADAWEHLARTIKDQNVSGFCAYLDTICNCNWCMSKDGEPQNSIEQKLSRQMIERLDVYIQRASDIWHDRDLDRNAGFIWAPHLVEPRIEFAKEMARRIRAGEDLLTISIDLEINSCNH